MHNMAIIMLGIEAMLGKMRCVSETRDENILSWPKKGNPCPHHARHHSYQEYSKSFKFVGMLISNADMAYVLGNAENRLLVTTTSSPCAANHFGRSVLAVNSIWGLSGHYRKDDTVSVPHGLILHR
jgi:hypothetical protein